MRLNPRLARSHAGADRSLSSVATRAITSATSSAGAASISAARRTCQSSVFAWLQRTTPSVARSCPERDTVHALPRAKAPPRDGAREAAEAVERFGRQDQRGPRACCRARWRVGTPGAPGRLDAAFRAGAAWSIPRLAPGRGSGVPPGRSRHVARLHSVAPGCTAGAWARVRLRPSVEISTCCRPGPIWRSIWRGSVTETEPPMARR